MQKLKRPGSKGSNVIARTRGVFFVLLLALMWGGVCFGADNPPGKENTSGGPAMALPPPGAEAAKLAKLFGVNGTWSGSMKPGAMGPNSPELPTAGTWKGHAVADGFWYICHMLVKIGDAKSGMTWKGSMIVGWDANAQTYRAVLADNLGILVIMRGEMTDAKFVLTSTEAETVMGQKTKARFTWDFSNPKAIQFTNEHQADGGPWRAFETETLKLAD
jgi:hypothetical protein